MRTVKEALHEKRHTTENHIKQLVQEGKQGIRYTAMMPDIPFLVLGLLSDVGWMIHLTAGVIYSLPKRFSPCRGLHSPRRPGCCRVRCRLHHLSEQDTRERDRHQTPKRPQLWCDGVFRSSQGDRRHRADPVYRHFARAGVDRHWRLFEFCRGIADLFFL